MKKCEFCTHELDLSGLPDGEVDGKDMAYCYIWFHRQRDSFLLEYGSPGDGYDGQSNQVKINYCPVCGRKLVPNG